METWQRIRVDYAAASVALLTASTALGALALLVLFERKRHWAWWGRFTLDYFYVQALCQFTPAQAGEVTLPYIAGRGRFGPGEIAAALVIQRMTSIGIVIVVAVAGAGKWAGPRTLWGTATFALAACLAVAALISHSPARSWLNEFVSRRFGPILHGFHKTWIGVFQDGRGRLALHVMIMIGRFVVAVAASYAMFMAFGVTSPFSDFAALSAWATLAAVAPISVSGLGVTEAIFVAGLASYGNGTEQVLFASLTGRALWFLNLLAWSTAYWVMQLRGR